jgi:hypothetical protein
MNGKGEKRSLTVWEKTAIAVIAVLIILILVLIFREQLEEYIRIFMDWYENENLGK